MLIGLKMVLVFALLGGTLWWLRRHDRSSIVQARRGEKPVAVLAQTRVGKSASVAVVRIGTVAYAVGITDQSVALLVPDPVVLPDPADPADAEQTSGAGGVAGKGRTAPPSPAEFVRGLLRRRHQVEYLEVDLPLPRIPAPVRSGPPHDGQTDPAADGTARVRTARKPEPTSRR